MNYKKLVKDGGFISQYMDYMSDIETPEAYDFWCAIWAIGATCGRNVFVDRPHLPVHLNWYIILSADSGTTRKSTAVRSIEKITDPLLGGLTVNTKVSPERLINSLWDKAKDQDTATCIIVVPEVVTLLGKEGYMVNMPSLLTDLYDCPNRIDGGTKDETITVRNIYVNLLSASTPSWLVTAINPQVIEGGFTSRVIFVAETKRKRAIPWPSQERVSEDRVRETLKARSKEARGIGKISCNTSGLAVYKKWYTSRLAHKDTYRSSFEAREDDHVLKLAACLSIDDGTFQIGSRHIRKATRVIAEVKNGAYELFGEGSVNDTGIRINDGIDKVKQELIKAGMDGVRHNNLYKAVRHKIDSREFGLLISIMHEAGMIQMFEIKGTRGKIYRGTNHLESVGTTSRLLHQIAPR